MKKVLYLLLILLFAACQHRMISTKAVYVPVVTTPHNSGLGDPLATAFEKVNAGFIDVYATFLLKTPIDHLGTVDIDFVGFFNAAGDSIPPYIPVAYRSPITVTTDGGVIRFYENGVELSVPAYSPIYETNYFVKTGGDDTKTGLSDADAWAHHPWMSTWTGSVTLVAGDVVQMKRGDTWSISAPGVAYMTVAQSGSAGKPITTTAYGTGADPIIKIATDHDYPVIYADGKSYITFDNIEISHFTASHDASHTQTGFYIVDDAATPHDWTFTGNIIHNCGYDGIRIADNCYNITIGDVTAQTTATTTNYSNKIYDCSYAGIELYGCDPATDLANNKVYYNYIYNIAGDGTNAYGITFSANPDSHDWPEYIYARYNRVENIPLWTGMGTHGASYAYFQNNFIRNCRMGIVAFGNDEVGYPAIKCDHFWVENNTIVQPGASAVAYTKAIQVSSESAVTRVTFGYINDNIIYWEVREAEAAAYGVQIYAVDGMTMDGNSFTSGPTGTTNGAINVEAHAGQSTKNLTITNNFIANWDSGMDIYTTDIDGDVVIHSNIIHSGGDGIWLASEVLDAGTMTIYNNTIMSDHNANSRYPIRFSATANLAAGGTINIKDNILCYGTAAATGLYIQGPNTLGGTLAIDNNLYWQSSYATPYKVTGSEHNWADWNTHVYDQNGLNNTSPTFTNGGGSYLIASDFALTAGSPAINAGANTGVTLDFYGLPRVGNYDIGSIEKQ